MALPALNDWMATAQNLHKATSVVGAFQKAALEPLPNFLHLSTTITPRGLATSPLPFGTVLADFQAAALVYTDTSGNQTSFALHEHSQASLRDALLTTLQTQGHALEVAAFADTAPLTVEPQFAADYAHALYSIFTATARFRARLFHPMTPVVVWPHHFDLSFLVFTTPDATEEAPHMNFGFAPFSDGVERPYLYAYAWPLPDTGYATTSMPPHVRLNSPEFSGPLVWYDDFAGMDDTEGFVETTFLGIYRALMTLL